MSSVDPEKGITPVAGSGVEVGSSHDYKDADANVQVHDDFHVPEVGQFFWQRLSTACFEMRGVEPVPVDKRTDTQYLNVFTIFGTSVTSLLPVIGIGAVTAIGLPATYIITPGLLTGMRQMIQSRYCFGKYINILTTIVVTLTIIGVAHRATENMVNAVVTFLAVIGYYSGSSITCFLIEILFFRKGDPTSFDPAISDGRRLSALVGVLVPWVLIAPSMSQDWYTGLIASKVGDLGFEFAVILAALVYPPVRALEIKVRGRL